METEIQSEATSSEVSTDFSKILSGLALQKESAQSRLTTNRRRIHRALKRLGATKVVISYSGYGDSGQIDSVEIFKGDLAIKPFKKIRVLTSTSRFDHASNRWIDNAKNKSVPVQEALETLVYDWLETEHGGWENNDGASGECIVDVEGDSFLLEHTWYYTESETMEHSL